MKQFANNKFYNKKFIFADKTVSTQIFINKYRGLWFIWSVKGLKGTVVNLPWASLHERLLEIRRTVSLIC